MTYEEILNIDWVEQKDLTEYANIFDQASIMNSQLTEFSYQYLRNKLMTWREMVEEGLSNFNFFNFSVFRFAGVVEGDAKYYMGIIPRSKLLDCNLGHFYRRDLLQYFRDFITEDFQWFRPQIVWKEGKLEEMIKTVSSKMIDSPQLLSSAEILSYVVESKGSLDYSSVGPRDCMFDEVKMEELIWTIKNHPLITLIEVDKEQIYHYSGLKTHFSRFSCADILFNKEIIKLGLQEKFSEMKEIFGYAFDEDIAKRKLSTEGKTYEEDSLYWINDMGQPIFLTNESRFNQDYCTTKVDCENRLVKFLFKNPTPYHKRSDNNLIYGDYYHYGYFDEITVDFVNDKIVYNERQTYY